MRTCDCTHNRAALARSEIAVCFYCFEQYPPAQITAWCDGADDPQTAICPNCGVDAVVGFNGQVDLNWIKQRHQYAFATSSSRVKDKF